MYILDTCAVSELRFGKNRIINIGLLAWSKSVPAAALYISAIVLLEMELGVQLKENSDPLQGQVLRDWMTNQVLPTFHGRILPVDDKVAIRCAGLHAKQTKAYRDSLIAATGLVHNMTVVTRNVSDFQSTGVQLHNPWT